MHFSRLAVPPDRRDVKLARLVAPADLDLLQLDYPRPLCLSVAEGPEAEYSEFATGLIEQLVDLNRPLFLNPQFRVVSNAGWSDPYGCVEAAAQALVDGGNGQVLASAVRGSNLLPILEELQASGIDLAHAHSGASFEEVHGPIVAADLQFGAGPIAAAVAEGARVIVAGSYDPAAPLTAAAIADFGWRWQDYDCLAGAAVAAEAVRVPAFVVKVYADGWSPRRGVLEPTGAARFAAPEQQSLDAAAVESWLAREFAGHWRTADVEGSATAMRCEQLSDHDVRLSGAVGKPGPQDWRLNIVYFSHFAADVLISGRAGGRVNGSDISLEPLERYFTNLDNAERAVTADWIQPSGGPALLRVQCRSEQWKQCRELANEAWNIVHRQSSDDLESFGPPSLTAQYAVWPTRVPREAIDIAVDTRPAREWL